MRIGRDENFLRIESVDPADSQAPWRVEAVAVSASYRQVVVHERVMPETAQQTVQRFREFSEHKVQVAEVPLTEDGWLKFERDARGGIAVRYRLASWSACANCEGMVQVEGEFAAGFCGEFGFLLGRSS